MPSCPICQKPLLNKTNVGRHMERYHPREWANSNPGKQITYFPCDVPGCNKLNTRHIYYVEHLSRVHGIDAPSMKRTTVSWYLESKSVDVLEMHAIEEATELNELNRKIRDIEHCFALDPPAGGYMSCHGFDVTTNFNTSQILIPQRKAGLVATLQQIRNTRNEVGSLYTRPGVMDTRDGVFDDLRSLLDPADNTDLDDVEVCPDAEDDGSDNARSENAGPDTPDRDGPEHLSIYTLTPEEAFALLRQESAMGWWARIVKEEI